MARAMTRKGWRADDHSGDLELVGTPFRVGRTFDDPSLWEVVGHSRRYPDASAACTAAEQAARLLDNWKE